MRTRVEVVARLDARGRTVLATVRGGGQLAVRQTGEGSVHLVGAAAGPMGGDEVDVHLVVEPGASLTVRSAAAAIVLPDRARRCSLSRTRIEVAAGGRVELDLEPTIVVAGARHTARLEAQLDAGAVAVLSERVVLGRLGELAGRWRGATRVEVGGAPVLDTALELGPDAVLWTALSAPRALATAVEVRPADAPEGSGEPDGPVVGDQAVALPLVAPPGVVAAQRTAWGASLAPVLAALRDLAPAAVG